MTSIYFLASNKPIVLPEEINNHAINQLNSQFSINEAYEWWHDIVKPILTMPYLYEARGLEQDGFFVYLEKHMEIGDIIELFYMHNQDWHEKYISRALEKPEPITINVGSYTYQNQFGIYQLNAKHWVEELRHRTLLTERGVTTIVKY